MMSVLEGLVALTLVLGGLFTLVGAYGLLKLDNPMSRLHAPTKAGTMGVGSILVASMIYAFEHGEGSVHELLILAFLFVTAPVSAHFIAKVVIHTGQLRQALPSPGEDEDWATSSTKENDTDPMP